MRIISVYTCGIFYSLNICCNSTDWMTTTTYLFPSTPSFSCHGQPCLPVPSVSSHRSIGSLFVSIFAVATEAAATAAGPRCSGIAPSAASTTVGTTGIPEAVSSGMPLTLAVATGTVVVTESGCGVHGGDIGTAPVRKLLAADCGEAYTGDE